MLEHPKYEDMNGAELAKELGISIQGFYRLAKKVDWPAVLERRRARFSRHTLDVDTALIKKAKEGEIQHIRTYYERFDGWVPTSAVKKIADASDSELLEHARKIREQLEGGAKQDSAGTGPTANA